MALPSPTTAASAWGSSPSTPRRMGTLSPSLTTQGRQVGQQGGGRAWSHGTGGAHGHQTPSLGC